MEKTFNEISLCDVAAVEPVAHPVSELLDAQLALVGGGIGDTVL